MSQTGCPYRRGYHELADTFRRGCHEPVDPIVGDDTRWLVTFVRNVVNIEYNSVWYGNSTGMPRTMGRVMIELLERNEVQLLPHHLC